MELQPAVAAVDGNALEQVVESGALHLDQRVVRAFERQPVADVLVDKGEPAERMRRYRQLQGAPVRQVHQLVLRLDQRGEQLASLALEGAEIGEFREAAGSRSRSRNSPSEGSRGEPGRLDPPQAGEGAG